MKLRRSIADPVRENVDWNERWRGADNGLIACWERGREKRLEDPLLASQAGNGQLVVLSLEGRC